MNLRSIGGWQLAHVRADGFGCTLQMQEIIREVVWRGTQLRPCIKLGPEPRFAWPSVLSSTHTLSYYHGLHEHGILVRVPVTSGVVFG